MLQYQDLLGKRDYKGCYKGYFVVTSPGWAVLWCLIPDFELLLYKHIMRKIENRRG